MKQDNRSEQPGAASTRPEDGLSQETPGDQLANRRAFLGLLALTSGALLLAPLPFAQRFLSGESRTLPRLALVDEQALPPGEATTFHYPDKDSPALLVRLHDGQWRAYAGTCTHLGCLVHWDATSGRLLCPCHAGEFAAENGAVVSGPPPRPLPQIRLEMTDGVVYAVGMET